MQRPTTPIDINTMPDLAHLVDEVTATKTPRALQRDNKIVAVLTPVETARNHQNKEAIEETLALAGAWKDVDFDDMLEQLTTIRHASKPTPALELDL